MKNLYFVLNPEVFLVKGALRGALYDLKSGNVFSVNPRSVDVLECLESGFSIMESSRKVGIELVNVLSYLSQLEKFNLGKFIDGNYHREKKIIEEPAEKLDFIHLELTESCNFQCVHCYSEASPINIKTNEIKFNEWFKVLKSAYELECKGVQFIGGEPFLRRKMLFQLIIGAKNIGYKFIEVFSNCFLMTDEDLAKLKEYSVRLGVSIFSSNFQIHDKITQRKGSWEKMVKILRRAKEFNIPTRVAIIVMDHNEKSVEETVSFLENQLDIKNVKIDFVRPSGRGCNAELISETMNEKQKLSKPNFAKINYYSFIRAKHGHNCFFDKICISSTGEIHPCVMEREISYGNIRKQPLIDILSSKIARNFKYLSKDSINVCKDCEYRYCCFDCRVKTKNTSQNNIYSKPSWCMYNPYTGQWLV